MAKKPTNDTFAQVRASLAADIESPRVVADIDAALEKVRQQWMDLLDLRKMAVRWHGESGAVPELPAPERVLVEQAHHASDSVFAGTVETIADLVKRYQTDERSPFQTVRYRTRRYYEVLLLRVENDVGKNRLVDLKSPDFESFHEMWVQDGKKTLAHSLIGMLRQLFGFGARVLVDSECERLAVILSKLKFKLPPPRYERLLEEHVNSIRNAAHSVNRRSMALAQVLQFELELRQRDVIGEWMPLDEEEEVGSDTIRGNEKWVRGLRWEEIDQNLVLRHPGSQDGKIIERDLRRAPMLLDEFKKIYGLDLAAGDDRSKLPATGPLVVADISEFPWKADEFRRLWRKIATAAGVPLTVRNMDSTPRKTQNNKPIRPEWTGTAPLVDRS